MRVLLPDHSWVWRSPPQSCSALYSSAALSISDIPFAGPIGAVRVGRVNGEFVANPTHDERAQSDLDLVYVGTENDVIMIEGSANEMPEAELTKALEFAHGHAREMIQAQKELASRVGKPKREVQLLHVNQEMVDIGRQIAGPLQAIADSLLEHRLVADIGPFGDSLRVFEIGDRDAN